MAQSFDTQQSLTLTLPALCAEIAACLPGEWSVSQPFAHAVRINGADGVALHCRIDRDAPKITVAGCLPREGITSYHIGVSLSRGAAVIAREIVRRLMPLYLPALAGHVKRQAEADAAEAARTALVSTLCAEFPKLRAASFKERTLWYPYDGLSLRIEIDAADCVNIRLDSLSAEATLAVLRAVIPA